MIIHPILGIRRIVVYRILGNLGSEKLLALTVIQRLRLRAKQNYATLKTGKPILIGILGGG